MKHTIKVIIFVEQILLISLFIYNAVDCFLIRLYAFKNWANEPLDSVNFHFIGLFNFMGNVFFRWIQYTFLL